MPIYRLSPVPELLREPAWDASPYRGDVWVNAADEAEARGLTSGRYEDARGNIPGVSGGPSPWLESRLVGAAEVAEGPGGMTIPYGTVVADRQL